MSTEVVYLKRKYSKACKYSKYSQDHKNLMCKKYFRSQERTALPVNRQNCVYTIVKHKPQTHPCGVVSGQRQLLRL